MLPAPTKDIPREIARVYSLAFVLIIGGLWLLRAADLPRFSNLLTGAVFLLVPAVLFQWRDRQTMDPSVTLSGVRRHFRVCLLYGLPILFIYGAADWAYRIHFLHKAVHFQFGWTLFPLALAQVLFVAFPEEFFFRGYIQSRLDEFARANPRKPGLQAMPIVATAALFALGHFLTAPQPHRLATFFPGLLFGYLRARTGSIIAPVIVHAAANVMVVLIEGGGL